MDDLINAELLSKDISDVDFASREEKRMLEQVHSWRMKRFLQKTPGPKEGHAILLPGPDIKSHYENYIGLAGKYHQLWVCEHDSETFGIIQSWLQRLRNPQVVAWKKDIKYALFGCSAPIVYAGLDFCKPAWKLERAWNLTGTITELAKDPRVNKYGFGLTLTFTTRQNDSATFDAYDFLYNDVNQIFTSESWDVMSFDFCRYKGGGRDSAPMVTGFYIFRKPLDDTGSLKAQENMERVVSRVFREKRNKKIHKPVVEALMAATIPVVRSGTDGLPV